MAAPGPPRLEVVRGSLPRGASAALLAGSFNPITRAHTALAIAGHRSGRDRVVLAMAPVSLDKEEVERAHPVDRLDWLRTWARRHACAAASGGEPLDELVPSAIARSIRRTGAYDPDPGPYLARARELDRLLSAQWRTED